MQWPTNFTSDSSKSLEPPAVQHSLSRSGCHLDLSILQRWPRRPIIHWTRAQLGTTMFHSKVTTKNIATWHPRKVILKPTASPATVSCRQYTTLPFGVRLSHLAWECRSPQNPEQLAIHIWSICVYIYVHIYNIHILKTYIYIPWPSWTVIFTCSGQRMFIAFPAKVYLYMIFHDISWW